VKTPVRFAAARFSRKVSPRFCAVFTMPGGAPGAGSGEEVAVITSTSQRVKRHPMSASLKSLASNDTSHKISPDDATETSSPSDESRRWRIDPVACNGCVENA
jgi:hypothetical protein